MSYSIIQADLNKNKKDIFDIWRNNSRGNLDKKYNWIFKNNPAGVALVWMVRHEETGENVGLTALFPRRFLIEGESIIGGIAGDFLVNKSHRSVGPALMLQKSTISAAKRGMVDFIYGFPNKAAEPILKRVGYTILGERVRLVKVLKTAPQIVKLAYGKYIAFLGPIFDIILRSFSAPILTFPSVNLVCEELNDFDERFDLFWRKANLVYSVIAERTSEYLRWKFLKASNTSNKIIAVFDATRQEMYGYIIFCLQKTAIEIRDFLFAENSKATRFLMNYLFKNAGLMGVETIKIELVQDLQATKIIKQFGFRERNECEKAAIFIPEKTLAKFPYLKERENWFLMQSDSDM